jgi:hypothetical protein
MTSKTVQVHEAPTKTHVSASIRGLRPGASMVLERVGAEPGDWYIQVWRRPEGQFQLEYRAGAAAEHFQTRTDSVEHVVDAFFGWVDGEVSWMERFGWTNIGSWFESEAEGEVSARITEEPAS